MDDGARGWWVVGGEWEKGTPTTRTFCDKSPTRSLMWVGTVMKVNRRKRSIKGHVAWLNMRTVGNGEEEDQNTRYPLPMSPLLLITRKTTS